jgi:hypothetical protein
MNATVNAGITHNSVVVYFNSGVPGARIRRMKKTTDILERSEVII